MQLFPVVNSTEFSNTIILMREFKVLYHKSIALSGPANENKL